MKLCGAGAGVAGAPLLFVVFLGAVDFGLVGLLAEDGLFLGGFPAEEGLVFVRVFGLKPMLV
jgi:hypothetical protein